MNWAELLPPLIMVAAIAIALIVMVSQWRRARLIEDTPTSRIRSAPQGYVELSGFARADAEADESTLLAPLTRIPCVWYRYRIERYERGGKNSRWNTIESGSSERWFALDDGSGRCHVDPRGAEVTPKNRDQWKGQSKTPIASGRAHMSPLDSVFGNFEKLGEKFSISLGDSEYRYTEWRIHADEFVYALGDFSTLHAPGTAQRTQVAMKDLLNQWKQNRDELLARFDRNGDGEIDLQEWEQARHAAEREARANTLSAPAAPAISVLSRPAHRDKPFLIATSDPERLARRHRRQALASLVIGAIIAAVAGWQTFNR